MAATPRSRTLVASSRPPSPTSTTTRSTDERDSSSIAAAVSASNSVGAPTAAATRSIVGRTSEMAVAKRSSLTGWPSTAMRSRQRIGERHAAAPDVDRQGFGRAREAFLGNGAAAGLAVLAVVAASPCGTDPLDCPQLPAWSAQDEGRAAVADREVAVLDLPAH